MISIQILIFEQLKKTFNILFAIYFLALVAMPCGDKEDCNEANHTEIAQASDHKEHSGEVCTPFCSCACCASHFITADFTTTLRIIATVNTVYTIHKETKITTAIIPVWQPPKLA